MLLSKIKKFLFLKDPKMIPWTWGFQNYPWFCPNHAVNWSFRPKCVFQIFENLLNSNFWISKIWKLHLVCLYLGYIWSKFGPKKLKIGSSSINFPKKVKFTHFRGQNLNCPKKLQRDPSGPNPLGVKHPWG